MAPSENEFDTPAVVGGFIYEQVDTHLMAQTQYEFTFYSCKLSKKVNYNASEIENGMGFVVVLTSDQYRALMSICTIFKTFDTNVE